MSIKLATKNHRSPADYMAYICLGIFVLLPFHAFFTTWAGSTFGHIDIFRIWKEIIIFGLSVGCVALLLQHGKLRKKLFGSGLFLLICLYALLALLRTLYGYYSGVLVIEPLIFGALAGLRYFLFFVVVWAIASKSSLLKRYWAHAVLTPATIVVLFGVLQQTVLDKNFLSHFGYSGQTVPAFQNIDSKSDYVRIQSFLRGPNPLGAYLVFVITFLVDYWYGIKRKRLIIGLVGFGAVYVLFNTFSRSAWVGALISLFVWVLLTIKSKKVARNILLFACSIVLVVSMTVFAFRNNDYIQNTFFHTDETSQSVQSSNAARTNAIAKGARDVLNHPLGQGLGSAGPASARGANPKIAENYYIQVAQETGVFGLVIFIFIIILVGKDLYKKRDQDLARVLLASLAGLVFINFVSHAWMDDTISLLWWGLAGIAVAQSVTIKNNRHGNQAKNQKAS